MKAMTSKQFGPFDKLRLTDLPTPKPQKNEVQIKVAYAGVNPIDCKIAEGLVQARMPSDFPLTLGWECSGVVSMVGSDVKKFKVGDHVFVLVWREIIKDGTFAEFICFDADKVALMPKNIGFKEAGVIPLTGLTAWQSLVDFGKIKAGQTVLIHAGAGGIGSMAIQIAKAQGAKVYTTARAENHAYVKRFGADVAIDYTKEKFADVMNKLEPKGVDIVYDTIGKETLKESVGLVKKGGVLISITDPLKDIDADALGIRKEYVFVKSNGKDLSGLAAMIEKGTLQMPTIEEFPLEKAAVALTKQKSGRVQGKLVLKVSESEN